MEPPAPAGGARSSGDGPRHHPLCRPPGRHRPASTSSSASSPRSAPPRPASPARSTSTVRSRTRRIRGLEPRRRRTSPDAGIGMELGLARRESPHEGRRKLRLARALLHDLPETMAALERGDLNERRAEIIATETADLTAAQRRAVDAAIRPDLAALGDADLRDLVRREVLSRDEEGWLARHARARTKRRVSGRIIGDGMGHLSAVLPATDLSMIMTSLNDAAEAAGAVDERGRGQLLADALHRAPGRPRSHHARTDGPQGGHERRALLGESAEPGYVLGAGYVPASVSRQLAVAGAQHLGSTVQRLFAMPRTGALIAMESASSLFRGSLPAGRPAGPTLPHPVLQRPDQAPRPRVSRSRGGATSADNAQGLCEGCNYAKESPGWRHEPVADPLAVTEVRLTTPTGHTHLSRAPASRSTATAPRRPSVSQRACSSDGLLSLLRSTKHAAPVRAAPVRPARGPSTRARRADRLARWLAHRLNLVGCPGQGCARSGCVSPASRPTGSRACAQAGTASAPATSSTATTSSASSVPARSATKPTSGGPRGTRRTRSRRRSPARDPGPARPRRHSSRPGCRATHPHPHRTTPAHPERERGRRAPSAARRAPARPRRPEHGRAPATGRAAAGPASRQAVIAVDEHPEPAPPTRCDDVVPVDEGDREPVVARPLGERRGERDGPEEQGPGLHATPARWGPRPAPSSTSATGRNAAAPRRTTARRDATTTRTQVRCNSTPRAATRPAPPSAPEHGAEAEAGVEARHQRATEAPLDLDALDVDGHVPLAEPEAVDHQRDTGDDQRVTPVRAPAVPSPSARPRRPPARSTRTVPHRPIAAPVVGRATKRADGDHEEENAQPAVAQPEPRRAPPGCGTPSWRSRVR